MEDTAHSTVPTPLPLPERVDEWLRDRAGDEYVFHLLKLCFGRVFIKRGIDDFEQHESVLESGRRWIVRAIEMKSGWLDLKDHLGRPKKLMKFSNVDGIVKEILKDQAKDAQHCARLVVTQDDEEVFAELEGGFCLVKLKTKQALVREGGALQNCLGDGHYDEYLANNEFQYFVLKDARSKSHAIIEVRSVDNLVWEIRGKQNVIPKMKYLVPLARFFHERRWPINNRWKLGTLIDAHGRIHLVENCPETLDIHGDLCLYGCTDIKLPEKLSVTGWLVVSRSNIAVPAERLRAGCIQIKASSGALLAREIEVEYDFELEPTAEFPEIAHRLTVGRSLLLSGNPHIRRLPARLLVYSLLDLSHTDLDDLGEDVQVLGDVCGGNDIGSGGHRFVKDAKRNLVQPGDIVLIVKNPPVPHGYTVNLEGTLGALKEVVSPKVAIVEYPAPEGVAEATVFGSSLYKLPRARIEARSAILEDGVLTVDVEAQHMDGLDLSIPELWTIDFTGRDDDDSGFDFEF